uniref:Uncharacterized protein n=1 Tax=uncultured marine virus TaxID=186617 RepID=A0A0F7LAV1_9VIRU|nr:hypothetical protein [uncultured marine virus]
MVLSRCVPHYTVLDRMIRSKKQVLPQCFYLLLSLLYQNELRFWIVQKTSQKMRKLVRKFEMLLIYQQLPY